MCFCLFRCWHHEFWILRLDVALFCYWFGVPVIVFPLSAFNLFMWLVFHCDFAHQFTRLCTMCSCEVDEFDDVSRSGHSTFFICAVWCPRTSPHFPALPRTGFPALPRTSPHSLALPSTSLDFFGLAGLGEIRMLFSCGFLGFPLQKNGKDSASQPEIIKNTNRTACIQKSMRASHKFEIFTTQDEENCFFHSKRCHKPRTNLYPDRKCLKVDLGRTKNIVSFQEMVQTKNKSLSW